MDKIKKIFWFTKLALATAAVFVLSFNLLHGSNLRLNNTDENWAAAAITILAVFLYSEFRKK